MHGLGQHEYLSKRVTRLLHLSGKHVRQMQRFLTKRFELVKSLNRSRDAISILGEDRWSGKTVVVKCLSHTAHRKISQFTEQLAWYHGLTHPLVAKILYAGLTPMKDPYFVRDWCENGRKIDHDITDRETVVSQLIAACSLLRSANVIHGHLKPSNLWVNRGKLKLLDGGLPSLDCRYLELKDISFCAPEVLTGGAATLESDLYSLGAVLYRLYAGRNLFEDSDLRLLRHKCRHAQASALTDISETPEALSSAVSRLIAKDPSERHKAFNQLIDIFDVQVGPAQTAPLSGRRDEIKRAATILYNAGSGIQIISIEGDTGSGKTRLVEELAFRHELRQGHFLIGRSYERDNRQFEPILQVLSERFKRPDKKLDEWIRTDGVGFAYSLKTLLPDLEDQFAVGVSDLKLTTEKLVADLAGTLLSITKRDPSILVAIEDIHWADEGTSRVLEQVALRSGEANLRLMVTHRTYSNQVAVRSWLETLRLPDVNLEQISLRALVPKDSREMARSLTIDTNRIAWIVKNGAGNPLFLEECARYRQLTTNNLPQRISDVVIEKMNRLHTSLKSTAELLALFPRPISVELASQVVQSLPGSTTKSIEDLVAAGILITHDGQLGFRHDGIRESTYGHIPRPRRRRLHKTIYEMLSPKHADTRSIAYHAERAGLFREAIRLYEKAAAECKMQNNYQVAIELFGISVRLYKKCGEIRTSEAYLSHAECLGSAGKTLEAKKTLLQIEGKVPAHTELKATIYKHLGSCSLDSHYQSVRYHTLAIDHLPAGSRKLPQFRMNLAQAYSSAGRVFDARRVLAESTGHKPSTETLNREMSVIKGTILLILCDYAQAFKILQQEHCQDAFSASALNNIAVCLEHLGDLVGSCRYQQRALDLSRQLGLLVGELQSLANVGAFETKKGDLRRANAFFQEADRFCNAVRIYRGGNRTNLPLLAADQAILQTILGEYVAAQRHAQSALRRLASDSTSQKAIWIALKVAEYYYRVGDTAKAQKALHRVQDSELYQTAFFQVEHALAMCQIEGTPSPDNRDVLDAALQTTHKLGTLYQRCRVLIELAAAHIATKQLRKARTSLIEAQKLANNGHYGILRPRVAFLRAFATESAKSREHYLGSAYQLASELPYPELLAESSFHLASHQLEQGNLAKAHEYASKSVRTIEKLAAQVPTGSRKRYLKVAWRIKAREMLAEINNQLQRTDAEKAKTTMTPQAGPLSRTLYAIVVAIAEAKNTDALADIVSTTLAKALKCKVVVCLTVNEAVEFYATRVSVDKALSRRISKLCDTEREQPYYGTEVSEDEKRPASIRAMAWVPLTARNNQFGGIYLSLGPRRFLEAEMEFVTTIGVVASHVLATILWSSTKLERSDKKVDFENIIGQSREIREVYSQIKMAATSNTTVLIEGESGTGKELVARAIHKNSNRSDAPLITVDCGAIPDTLIESELFGSRRGSFTGATADRAGLIEAAHKGTLFLDEISNTSPSLQVRLLRVLQEKEVRRIGDAKGRAVDVRLIAATNSNLEALVEEGQFRQDLFYRLNVLHITVPPLRKRKEDIPAIAQAFLERLNKANKSRKRFSTAALEQLTAGHYRGNVRELQNLVERAYLRAAESNTIKQVAVNSADAGQEADEVSRWFKDLRDGRANFWSAVHSRYKKRDISREKVIALMDLGLRETHGSYKSVAKLFHVEENEYRRFMDFLRRNDCQPDFRPYRRLRLE